MSDAQTVRLYLEPSLRDSALAGTHNFIARIVAVLEAAGLHVEIRGNGPVDKRAHRGFGGWSLVHMEAPWDTHGLTFRRAYHYPFWAIEPHAERWLWHVAQTPFDPSQVVATEAARFAAFWRKRLFPGLAPGDEGYLYLPLQGRLAEHRSFQTMSPLAMVEAVLAHDPRPVVATLHPRETYTAADLDGLERLAARFPRLRVETGQMERFLPACSAVVTQNSSAAFNGYFFAKPAVLFARIDFHHIAAQVDALGVAGAMRALSGPKPAFDRYIWWFWQKMSINAGRPEAGERIAAALRRGGWPV